MDGGFFIIVMFLISIADDCCSATNHQNQSLYFSEWLLPSLGFLDKFIVQEVRKCLLGKRAFFSRKFGIINCSLMIDFGLAGRDSSTNDREYIAYNLSCFSVSPSGKKLIRVTLNFGKVLSLDPKYY